MAFLDCRDAALHALPDLAALDPDGAYRADLASHFDAMELRVVQLAHGDTLKSLRPQRPRGRLARLVLGPRPPSRQLANPRLEALRRLVVHAWHKGFLLPASVLHEAEAAGFSDTQIGVLVDSIGRARSCPGGLSGSSRA
ncbi:hypothetical protein [Novosphingobium profundi]|uniref:hypothetical protein n=1 Tax=Novosphingobium profundi TaxID=1774954 RepID=UPI001CFD2AA0|nr:hypothetical protein [Novosphingobium profundi]